MHTWTLDQPLQIRIQGMHYNTCSNEAFSRLQSTLCMISPITIWLVLIKLGVPRLESEVWPDDQYKTPDWAGELSVSTLSQQMMLNSMQKRSTTIVTSQQCAAPCKESKEKNCLCQHLASICISKWQNETIPYGAGAALACHCPWKCTIAYPKGTELSLWMYHWRLRAYKKSTKFWGQ